MTSDAGHLEPAHFLGLLAAILVAAKAFGVLARRAGQPAVIGELLAGVVLGGSVLGLVDPDVETIHLLAELGVAILLFEIGLETDLRKLVRVGGASAAVAAAGVVLPFGAGYAACRALGLGTLEATVIGAAMTATSVGITARVLADLGRLRSPEGQVVLGAAVIDDVVGLVMLTVVAGLAGGEAITAGGVATTAGLAFGFLAGTLLLGRLVVPRLFRAAAGLDLPGGLVVPALALAFGLAWLADAAGSALIIGAFAAGLLLAGTDRVREIEDGVKGLARVFVPLFFVAVGAQLDLKVFNPVDPANHRTLMLGGLLIAAAVATKLAAGYAPFWFRGNKLLIGVGMVPRGEVGLIFAQMGLATGALGPGPFGAVMLMVFVTTFLAPPWLQRLAPAEAEADGDADRGRIRTDGEPSGVADLVNRP